jgi:hypothetical protein
MAVLLASVSTSTTSPGGDGGGDAGGGGGGGGDADAASDDAPLTLKSFKSFFGEYSKDIAAKMKMQNDEIARYRHGAKAQGDDRDADAKKAGGEKVREDVVTRAEFDAQRTYDRELGRLESAGYDADALAEIEEQASRLDAQGRAAFVKGIREGFLRGRNSAAKTKDTATGDREVGAEHGKEKRSDKPTRGGEPPARTKTSQGPASWQDYLDTSKAASGGDKDASKRMTEWNRMIASEQLDLQELRTAHNEEMRRFHTQAKPR